MKSKRTRKGKAFDYTTTETQRKADRLFGEVIDGLKDSIPDIHWSLRDEQDQKDKGIDMQCELIERFSHQTLFLFKTQNKGTKKKLSVLKTTLNKGKISFPLDADRVNYYRYEMNIPVVIIVCDTEEKIVYWHPIQLDDEVDKRVTEAKKERNESVQIYIDPANQLSPDTAERFLKDLKDSQDEQIIRYNAHLKHPLFSDHADVRIDRTKHLFEQLYQAVTGYFDQFSYIPPRELVKLYPFSSSKDDYVHFERFRLTTDDENLYDVLEKISDPTNITDPDIQQIADYENKAATIVNQLLTTGIEYVAMGSGNKRFELSRAFLKGATCDCCNCCYRRGDFSGALSDANKPIDKDTIDTIFKKGYIHYKIGNYVTAFELFEAGAAKAKKNRKWIQYAIAIFNMKSLRRFVQLYAFGHTRYTEVIERIRQIDFEKELDRIQYKKYFGGELVKWMLEQRFYSQYFINVANVVQEIEKQYHAQLNGGWIGKQTAGQLLSEIYQAVSFVNYNFIIFDRYSDFDDLFDFATKGYMVSYALPDSKYSRLQHFNGNVLQQLTGYAKPETIITYYNRYSPNDLQFHPVTNPSMLTSQLFNLLDNYRDREALRKVLEPGNTECFRLLGEMVNNLLVLITLSDVHGEEINHLADRLISYDHLYGILNFDGVKYFGYLLSRKAKDIKLPTWIKVIKRIMFRHSLPDKQLLDVVVGKVNQYFPEYTIDDSALEELIKGFGQNSDKSSQDKTELLVSYSFIATAQGKQKISEKIITLLEKHFQPSLYYDAAVHRVIDYKPFLEKFIAFARPNDNRRQFDLMFSGHADVFSRPIDMLAHLLFKFDDRLQGKDLQDMQSFSKYYEWLFDLEGFDYSHFDTFWLLNHPTRIYLDRFRKIPAIKQSLVNYLKANLNTALTKIFMDYFSDEKNPD